VNTQGKLNYTIIILQDAPTCPYTANHLKARRYHTFLPHSGPENRYIIYTWGRMNLDKQ